MGYMTGGCVVVLGPVGRNVAAGMTGGLGYFYDEDESFASKLNPEIVVMQRVSSKAGEQQLKGLITDHTRRRTRAKPRICWTTGARRSPSSGRSFHHRRWEPQRHLARLLTLRSRWRSSREPELPADKKRPAERQKNCIPSFII